MNPKEFDLLTFFIKNKGLVLSREQILQKVWGYEYAGDTRTVDVHVRWLREKIEAVAQRIYGAEGVDYSAAADKQLSELEQLGFGALPVCMAKTQYSLSDDPLKLGAPKGFRISVRSVKPSIGAGFIVAITGEIMTMPGLPKIPAAEAIDVDAEGRISGLF